MQNHDHLFFPKITGSHWYLAATQKASGPGAHGINQGTDLSYGWKSQATESLCWEELVSGAGWEVMLSQAEPGQSGRSREKTFIYLLVCFTIFY